MSRLQALYGSFMQWAKQDFMHMTVRRVIMIALLVCAYSYASLAITRHYYAADDMPPAFRNMDMTAGLENVNDYEAAHDIGPDSLLIMGDCVAYGNGAAEGFNHFLNIPGLNPINTSMHSMRYDLRLVVLDDAVKKGVKNVLMFLHPFHHYYREVEEWRLTLAPGVTIPQLSADDLIRTVKSKWRFSANSLDNPQDIYSFGQSIDNTWLTQYSEWLRQDVMAQIPLFRNRFVLDDALGIDASLYSSSTKRLDTFVEPLPEDQQMRIFTEQKDYWHLFVIPDQKQFYKDMSDYGAIAYLAKYAKERGINMVFVMVPTFVDKIAKNTVIKREDLLGASRVYRKIAMSYGAGYVDYLDNKTLLPYMYHFDNLTAAGQKKMGEMLTRDLPSILNRRGHP